MKSLIKPILLSSSFTAIALFSSFSSATANFNKSLFTNQGNVTVVMFALPHSKSEGKQQNKVVGQYASKSQSNNLLPQQLPKSGIQDACGKKKNNSLYELSAIFNDKLQMFIAYLNKSSKTQIAKQSDNKDKLGAPNSQIKL